MVVLQEVIDTVRMLTTDAPRTVNKDTKVGLYIELKNYSAILKE